MKDIEWVISELAAMQPEDITSNIVEIVGESDNSMDVNLIELFAAINKRRELSPSKFEEMKRAAEGGDVLLGEALDIILSLREKLAEERKRAEKAESNYDNEADARKQVERNYAKIESKTIVLPAGYAVRAGHPINEGERNVMIPKDGGHWLSRFEVEHAIRVAGFKMEGAE